MIWDTLKNFDQDEFKCSCCGKEDMNPFFLRRLQASRTVAGIPFSLSSAFRCVAHNEYVGGVKGSTHTQGIAVDIGVDSSQTRAIILNALFAVGFTRIGISKDFIHVDMKDGEAIWLY